MHLNFFAAVLWHVFLLRGCRWNYNHQDIFFLGKKHQDRFEGALQQTHQCFIRPHLCASATCYLRPKSDLNYLHCCRSAPLHQSSIIIRKKKGGGWRQYRSNIETFIWSRSVVAHACMRDAARFAVAASNSMKQSSSSSMDLLMSMTAWWGDRPEGARVTMCSQVMCMHVCNDWAHACISIVHAYAGTTIRALCIGHACDASKASTIDYHAFTHKYSPHC